MKDGTERYVYLAIPDKQIRIEVKLDDEGVVVDAYSTYQGDEGEGPIATTYEFYSEMGLELVEAPLVHEEEG